MARKRINPKFRQREFKLNVRQYAIFVTVRDYLNDKYTLYNAVFKNGVGHFKIKYAA